MKLLITGGSGLVGSFLVQTLLAEKHDVAILTRTISSDLDVRQYFWDPSRLLIDTAALEGIDYLIHLAGANVSGLRWTSSQRKMIYSSRVESANFLFHKIKELKIPLKSFITSSAVGFYGTFTSGKIFSEQDNFAQDFLGALCVKWEAAADQFTQLGCQVSKVRTGVVLASDGGALPKMIKPIILGVGSALGSGKQYFPWIHVKDLCRIYVQLVSNSLPYGVYNGVAPESITNKELTQIIADRLNKPLWLPNIPSWVLKIIFGNMASILLEGSRVSSEKLIDFGFEFCYPSIRSALNDLL